MKKRVIGLLMAACLVVGATTGCGGGSTATDTSASSAATDEADTEKAEVVEGDFDTVSLRLSCNGTDQANDTKAANLFAKLVNEKSGGKVTVTVFPNDQLAGGNMSKGLEMLCDGTVDLDVHSTICFYIYLSKIFLVFFLIAAGYLFHNTNTDERVH